MLQLLFILFYWWSLTGASSESSRIVDVSRPYIYYCRSPNMETFTCWWRPLNNSLQGDDNIAYRLFYTLGGGLKSDSDRIPKDVSQCGCSVLLNRISDCGMDMDRLLKNECKGNGRRNGDGNGALYGDASIQAKATGKRPLAECPDYMSGGPNSCYFDAEYTEVWEVYCMNVTAYSSSGSITSNQHCLDVAEIVETDPPFNLTYTLMNMTKDETGHTVLVSWQYPIAQHVQLGWITLIYELRYRAASEPNNWKVRERLREPHLELLSLSVGSYVVKVRCRSQNSHLWSKWSSPITIVIPSTHLPDKMLYALVLVTTTVVIILLIVGLGVIPRGKRIKAFLLPPIPKPYIRGIDPMLLKKGKMDDINHHFSSLASQGYKAPHYSGESVFQVSSDDGVSLSQLSSMSSIHEGMEPQDIQSPACCEDQQLLHTPDSPSPYCQDPSFCNDESPDVTMPLETTLWAWSVKSPMQPELLSFPDMDYSMIVNPAPTSTQAPPPTQEFYTCVHGLTTNEMVELVPCMSVSSFKGSPYFEPKEDTTKLSQLAAYLEKRVEDQANESRFYPGGEEQNEYAVPLLPQLTDTN